MDKNLNLSPSGIKTYLDCPRKFLWTYGFNIEPVHPDVMGSAADAGSIFHEALSELYKGSSLGNAITYIQSYHPSNQYEAGTRTYIAEKEHLSLEKLAENLRHYYNRYFLTGEFFKVLGTEIDFFLPVTDSLSLNGVIDLLGQDERGEYIAIDHKTTSSNTVSIFLDSIKRSYQLPIYAWAIHKTFELKTWPKCIINGIFFSSIKKDPRPQFVRSEYCPSEEEIEIKIGELRGILSSIHEKWLFLVAESQRDSLDMLGIAKEFWRNGDTCYKWNRLCPYQSLCDSLGSSSFLQHYQLFQKRDKRGEK